MKYESKRHDLYAVSVNSDTEVSIQRSEFQIWTVIDATEVLEGYTGEFPMTEPQFQEVAAEFFNQLQQERKARSLPAYDKRRENYVNGSDVRSKEAVIATVEEITE